MKKLIIASGIGLVAATLTWLYARYAGNRIITPPADCQYTLQAGSNTPDREMEAVIRILRERLSKTRMKAEINEMNKGILKVKVNEVRDTGLVKKLLTAPGKFQIREIFDRELLMPAFTKARELVFEEYFEKTAARGNDSGKTKTSATDSIAREMQKDKVNTAEEYPYAVFFTTLKSESGNLLGSVPAKDTAGLRSLLGRKEITDLTPPGFDYLYGYDNFIPVQQTPDEKLFLRLYACRQQGQLGNMVIGNEEVVEASYHMDHTNQPVINIRLTRNGSAHCELLTEQNINKPIAFIHDNFVYSAPVVTDKISNGEIQLSAFLTEGDAAFIASTMSSSALPVEIRILSSSCKTRETTFQKKRLFIAAGVFAAFTLLGLLLLQFLNRDAPRNTQQPGSR